MRIRLSHTLATRELKDAVKGYMYSLGVDTGRSSLDDAVFEKVASMIYKTIRAERIQRGEILKTESEEIRRWVLAEMKKSVAHP